MQRYEPDRDVFIHPPKEISEPGKIWKLKRYNRANWYKRVKHEFINKLGGQISKFVQAYFPWHHENGTVSGITALHVDDFIHCDANDWLLNVAEPLKKVFKISKTANRCFKYLGLNFVKMMRSMLTKMPILMS